MSVRVYIPKVTARPRKYKRVRVGVAGGETLRFEKGSVTMRGYGVHAKYGIERIIPWGVIRVVLLEK